MIKLYSITVFVFLSIITQAQNTVNSSGNTLKADEATYSYSVGEVTGFLLTPDCSYTQGVIQPSKYLMASGYNSFFDSYEISLYPNPVRDVIIIETNYPGLATFQITAFDGKVVETGNFNYMPINIKQLQSGIYFLTFFSSGYKKKKTFKIMKL